jgi:opacity protein-like surface antigen
MMERLKELALIAALFVVCGAAVSAAVSAAEVTVSEVTATETAKGIVTLDANGGQFHYPKDRSNPFVAKSAKDLVAGLGAEVAKKVQSKVDFKTHHVLVFRWRNSGSDNFEVQKPKKKGEAIQFKLTTGNTKASIADIRCYAVPIGVKWHYSSVSRDLERIRIAQ